MSSPDAEHPVSSAASALERELYWAGPPVPDGTPAAGVTADSIKRIRNVETAAASQALVALHEAHDLAGTQVGRLVDALPDSVKESPLELRGWLERWFDGQMTALSGSYRRRIRWWAAAVAAVVVLVVGVDSLGFAERVYQ